MWKGDPNNPAPNQLQSDKNVSDVSKTENRSENIRRDQDTIKDFTVSLLDIDTAILTYIDKTIDIHVLDHGKDLKVPIKYAAPETWKSIQKDGYLRDGQGKFQMPIVAFSRSNIEKNQDMLTINRHLTYPVVQGFSEKNRYTQFNIINQKTLNPQRDVFSVTLPDHVNLTYQFIAQCEFVEQLNKIVQRINFATEEYWGDPHHFRFRVYINDYSITTESGSEDDRMVKAEFNANVKAYLLEDSFESRKLTTQRGLTKRKVVVGAETVVGPHIDQKPYPYSWKDGVVKKDKK